MKFIGESLQTAAYTDRAQVGARSIRVLLVITGLATGGATNVVLDIARHLRSRPEFEVELITGPIPPGRNDVTHRAFEMDIPTRVVPSLVNRISPLTNFKAVSDLYKIMVRGEYDIVHTHSSVAGIVGRFAALAAGIPIILHHVHGWALHSGMSSWTKWIYLTLERVAAHFTDRIITVAGPDIQKGHEQGIGKEEKFTLIHNGIDLEKFRRNSPEKKLRKELGLEPNSKVVGMVGRLDEQKNPLDLIRAAAVVVKSRPDVQFLVVGDGNLRPECESLIAELGLQGKFLLPGFRDDVARIMPMLSITAMSSLWEGLPLAFMEAMSAGKPIVANDVDGASDVVKEGETGFLVPPHQPEVMAERILTLLNDEPLSERMGEVARERSENYSVQKMIGSLDSLYKERFAAFQNDPPRSKQILGWIAGRSPELYATAQSNGKANLFTRLTESTRRFQAPFSERRILLWMGDSISLLIAQVLTLWVWTFGVRLGELSAVSARTAWLQIIPVGAIWIALAWLSDLYHVPSSYVKSRTLRRIIQTSVMALGIYTLVYFLLPLLPLSYYMILMLMAIVSVMGWRWVYTLVFKRNAFRQRVLIVGSGTRARATVKDISEHKFSAYQTFHVVGYVHDTEPKTYRPEVRYLGSSSDLPSVINRHHIQEVVISTDGRLKNQLFESLIECQSRGVRVSWLPEFYERLYQRVPVEHLDRNWALYMIQNRAVFNRIELGLKRLMDLALLLIAMPIFLVLLIPIAIAIKLDSKGPIFYRQVRLGRAGEPFTIFKFRTMGVDAERDGKARWADKDDPRITRVGSLLRKARLDEIPQLLNVLRGEMSIVGPRPERPEMVGDLEAAIPFYRMRLLVKPGITGWAQINYDYGRTVDDALYKLQYDFYYVRYWSIWLDLYTLFRTVGVVFMLKG
jgi:exopolysaccharide biosynthesis polyprenyl glycosylphosphotransferase